MKLTIGLIMTLALAAGPAAAQQGTFGAKPKQTWSPGSPAATPSKPKSYGVPAPGAATTPGYPTKPKTYGAPEAPKSPGFKPYEGYKSQPGTSVFGPDGKKKR
jgi:hypothetical protein